MSLLTTGSFFRRTIHTRKRKKIALERGDDMYVWRSIECTWEKIFPLYTYTQSSSLNNMRWECSSLLFAVFAKNWKKVGRAIPFTSKTMRLDVSAYHVRLCCCTKVFDAFDVSFNQSIFEPFLLYSLRDALYWRYLRLLSSLLCRLHFPACHSIVFMILISIWKDALAALYWILLSFRGDALLIWHTRHYFR